jgi:hypothetical protein
VLGEQLRGARHMGQRSGAGPKEEEGRGKRKKGRKEEKGKKEKEIRKIGKMKIGKAEEEKIEKGKENRFKNLGKMLGKLGGRREVIFAGFSGFGC